jgi:hypothetical protein
MLKRNLIDVHDSAFDMIRMSTRPDTCRTDIWWPRNR